MTTVYEESKLKSKITNLENQPIDYVVSREKFGDRYTYKILSVPDMIELGQMKASCGIDLAGKPYFSIDLMNGYPKKFKNVGRALHEVAFRESFKLNPENQIITDAASGSLLFHLRCGFEVTKIKLIDLRCFFHLLRKDGRINDFIFWRENGTVPIPHLDDPEDIKGISDLDEITRLKLKGYKREEVINFYQAAYPTFTQEERKKFRKRLDSSVGSFHLQMPAKTVLQKKEEFGIGASDEPTHVPSLGFFTHLNSPREGGAKSQDKENKGTKLEP